MIEYIERRKCSNECYKIYEETVRENKSLTAAEVKTLMLRFEKAINAVPAVDAVPVVRCRDCFWYKPAHFAADDGKEYEWDGTMTLYARSDGIHVGGKCKHDRNTAYGGKDMAFRNPDDFCSYGERRNSDD